MALYYNSDYEQIQTLEDLKKEFAELKADGSTESETFPEYLKNCTSKNGALEQINTHICDGYDIVHIIGGPYVDVAFIKDEDGIWFLEMWENVHCRDLVEWLNNPDNSASGTSSGSYETLEEALKDYNEIFERG